MKQYDVFISYNSQYRAWIEVLAYNLKSQHLKVFLDDWEFIPGKHVVDEMNRGLENASNGILLASPEAVQSGWVKQEYYKMQEMQNKGSFRIIPIILGKEMPQMPFLSTIKCVDFRDHDRYSQSFHTLMCALKDHAPGPPQDYKGALKIPAPIPDQSHYIKLSSQKVVDDVFELLYTKLAVLLFMQRDRLQVVVDSCFYERAVQRFGANQVIHIVPPLNSGGCMNDFYAELGNRYQLGHTPSAMMFEKAIHDRLTQQEKICFLVTAFEHCSWDAQSSLATLFRSLNEHLGHKTAVIICGGEKLVHLSEAGDLSFLNHAEPKEWPSMDVAEIYQVHDKLFPAHALSEQDANALLSLSNGHMWLLEHYMSFLHQHPGTDLTHAHEVLMESSYVCQLLMPYLNDMENRKKISYLLEKDTIGPARYRYSNPFVKKLYWNNLLTRENDGKQLKWRLFFRQAFCKFMEE
jgi:hypothetical protein